MTDVDLHLQTEHAGTTAALADAWVYRLEGSTISRLRTDDHGHVFSLAADGQPDTAADYRQRLAVQPGDELSLCYSQGPVPSSDEALQRHPEVFAAHTVPEATIAPSQGAVAVSPDNTNTLSPTTAAVLTVPPLGATLTRPGALELWPVFWSLTEPTYATDGLDQGAALFNAGNLTVAENGAAPAPADDVRPAVRALAVAGTLTGTATRVRISVHDASGTALALRADGEATADVQEIEATISGQDFTANLLLAQPDAAFGEIDLDVVAEHGGHSALATAAGLLLGVQAALVDDHLTNANGQEAGTPRVEADEVIIVDFQLSPQADVPALSAQTRARRMVADDIATHDRALSDTTATVLEMPQMPLWMVELHLLGLTQARAESLLQRRRDAGVGIAGELRLSTQWSITLSWDGPNAAHTTRPYTYTESFPAATPPPTHTVRFALDAADALGVTLTPTPTAPTFPVADRRAAQVQLDTTRAWGRQADAPAVDGTVVEFQPLIVDAGGREIMRGGDGVLAMHSIQVDGVAVDPGLDPDGTAFVAPAADPVVRPPTFRVRGVNPVAADVPDMVDTVVEEYFTAHATNDEVAMLSLAQWQVTVRNIVRVESIGNHQFDHRQAGRYGYGGRRYGSERDMPIFGAPAGYGLGQLDSPPVTDDQAWSFIDNLRGSVRLIMRSKARAAHRFMAANLPNAPAAIDRAAFRREVVRRYNGNTEVRFRNGTWELFPTTQTARLGYPNAVLGTTIVYTTPRVAIPFPQAQFGPGF